MKEVKKIKQKKKTRQQIAFLNRTPVRSGCTIQLPRTQYVNTPAVDFLPTRLRFPTLPANFFRVRHALGAPQSITPHHSQNCELSQRTIQRVTHRPSFVPPLPARDGCTPSGFPGKGGMPGYNRIFEGEAGLLWAWVRARSMNKDNNTRK